MADTKSLLKASLTTRRARELGDAAHLAGTSMSATKQTGLARAKDKADAKSELLQSLETTPVKDIVGPLGGFVVDPEPSPTAPDILHSSAFAATSTVRDKKARPFAGVEVNKAKMNEVASSYVAPTDRIGKLYTPTAQHLTMKDAVRVSKWKAEAEKLGALCEDPLRVRERNAQKNAETLPAWLLPDWAQQTLRDKARSDKLARKARIAPVGYKAQEQAALFLEETASRAETTVGSITALEKAGEIDAQEAQTKRKERKDDARVRRRDARGETLDTVDAAVGKAPLQWDPEKWQPGQATKAPRVVEESPVKQAEKYQVCVENYWGRVRTLTQRGAAHAAGAGTRRPIANLPDSWLGGIAGRVAPPASLLKERARVLKARKVSDTVTSDAVDALADAEPEPWSIQAVERAEAVADDALAETKLAFSDGVARSMVEYELRDGDVCQMHAIDPSRLKAAPKWWTSDFYRTNKWVVLRDTGVSRRSVHVAKHHAVDRLRIVDRVMYDLHEAWLLPRRARERASAARSISTASSSQPTKPPFSRVLLTDVATDQFRKRLPMCLDDFCKHVDGRANAVRDALSEEWVPACASLLAAHLDEGAPPSNDMSKLGEQVKQWWVTPYEGPDVLDGSLAGDKAADAFDRWFVRTYGPDGLGRPDHRPKEAKPPSPTRMRAQRFREDTVLDCANMLMSTQLRSLVEESLDMFASFLERHDTDETRISLEAALELKLVVAEEGVVALEPSLSVLEERLCRCIDQCVLASRDFPCVDQENLRPPPDEGPKLMSVLGDDEASVASVDSLGAAPAPAPPPPLKKFLGPATAALTDEIVEAIKTRVRDCLRRRFEAPQSLVPRFAAYKSLVDRSLYQEVVKLIEVHRRDPEDKGDAGRMDDVEEGATADAMQALTKKAKELSALAASIRGTTLDIEDAPLFRVLCLECKEALATKAETLMKLINDAVAQDNRDHMRDANRRYQRIADKLVEEPTSSEELGALKEFAEEATTLLEHLEFEYREEIYQRQKFLLAQDHKLSKEDMQLCSETYNWPGDMASFLKRSEDLQNARTNHLKAVVEGKNDALGRDVERLEKMIEALAEENSLAPGNIPTVTKRVNALRDGLEKATEECEDILAQEEVLEMEGTDFEERLKSCTKEFGPLDKLWTCAKEWVEQSHAWHELPLPSVDAEAAASKAGEFGSQLARVSKVLEKKGESRENAARCCKLLLQETKSFEDDEAPLMLLVCEPGMKPRHWEEIKSTTKLEFSVTSGMNMMQLMDIGLNHYVHLIEDTCVAASKEAALEKALSKMELNWADAEFGTKEWRTGRILAGIDEIQQELDDQIVKTQAMHGSRYVKPFLSRVDAWEHTLTSLQDIIDNWLKVQAAWLYLEPIFSSDDITRQLPTESSMFTVVNGVWIESMAETAREPAVLSVARREGLLDQLTDANEKLDVIQKGLSDYLETKRLAFPRFFFLSNDELLEILAETKDPTKVQPHMKKCFDGIAHLDFDPDLNILAALDAPPPKGERLEFTYDRCDHRMINPKDSGGNVEKWLVEVETIMKKSLALSIDLACDEFFKIERRQWLRNWPGQTILTVNQITWVMAMEEAIENGGGPAIAAVLSQRVEELLDVVDTVRGDIPKLLRGTLGGLVVMDVHNRDITEWLSKTSISTVSEFDWQAQLRYYWDNDGVSSQTGKPETIPCRMINAMILYAYEYMGNCGRLVITPLTDRCYRTLMGAIHLNLGGAPEGPAGTGKTETTKDLGKAIAIQCVVTNCSDGLDYKAMAKFFKGLAASGAWACFDEFNRIILEVLSVVAQQVLTIQQAKARKAERFMFEGTDLPLRMTCCPFITMNPGYAGRAELPDNLKVLFRTVAMMVPDYAMIGEIILYSMGYTDAKAMAVKIVTTYKLCSEQLSAQSHYDYGMRAVIAVLRASGNLKRSEGHLPEDILVLRAIIDVNAPKFLAPDVPLFNGITSDLFPGVVLPVPDRKAMQAKSGESCVERNLQLTDYFWGKIVQIYDMMVVRHGFMIVGAPFSGKTSAYRVLADALSKLHAEYPEDNRWTDVVPFVMNPKSVTMGQLYGCFDPVSHEWTDGVLAIQYRNAAQSKVGKPEDRKWVLLDGPVDAIWIENMNTVLDDNKKLCLMSGEIIAMSDVMSMIFEPMDLLVASPATVSRCGMVYMEPEQLGLRPLWESWVTGWTVGGYYQQKHEEDFGDEPPPFELKEEEQVHLTALYDWLVEPALACLRRNCKEMSPTGDANLLTSLLGLLRCLLTAAIPGPHDADVEEGGSRRKQLECCFLFALFWSTGCTSDAAGRAKYSLFVREVMESVDVIDEKYQGVATALAVRKWVKPTYDDATQFQGSVECPPPDAGDLQDWCYDPRKGAWVNWVDTLEKFAIAEDAEFSTIMVPTGYTAQLSYMCQTLLTHGLRPLVCGPTGTGKSVSVVKCVTSELDQSKYKPIQLGFSAKTSAHMTQDIIDGNLGKRRKGTFGPPLGTTGIIFVDDANMPEVETYGAQPPIELLRQLVDCGGYYDLKEKSWVHIVDTVMCCAMGPPGGGRNGTTPRFLRHFHLLCVDSFDDDTLTLIFSTIVKGSFKRGYSGDVSQQAGNVVQATMRTYREAMKGLLPTPSKSHYTFNLRDFSRVVQGVLLQEPSDQFQNKPSVMRLWTHEALRVFGDRLTDDTDRQWMCDHCSAMCKEVFKCDFQSEFDHIRPSDETETGYGTLRRLFWGDYMTPADEDERPYAEVPDLQQLQERTEEALSDFNSASKKPMELVMFMFAIEHVSRIARVLRMPGGNALLVGVGGSGRQSLSILATEMAGYQLFRIEITKSYGMTEWREDLKTVLIEAGAGDRPLVFLFSDTQISMESFVEDINNMLNAGEVPNIFPSDERVAICEKVRPFAKEQFGRAAGDMSPLQLYAYFIQRVKQYLHIILAFSPIGSAFRDRLRLFPSLVNCCAIDWFTAWPGDALLAVAEKFLKEVKLDDEVRPAIVDMCMTFHTNAHDLAAEFLSEQGRITYVTPTSYLELIVAFKLALAEQREKIEAGKSRYQNGLKQLAGAEDNVATMQVELTDLQPVLAEAQVATDKLMEEIEAKLPGVREQEEVVGAEAAVAQKEADTVQIEVDSVQADLDEALPALESAVQALNTINDKDIDAVRKLSKPPATVKLVAEGVCVMLGEKPVKIPDPDDSSKKIMDYWAPSQKMMGDKGFIPRLKEYDKDNISPKIMKTIRTTYMPNEKFNAESAAKASSAAAGLCKWVLAMECYDRVAKVVAPKKEALEKTQAALAITMGELNKKKASLKVVQDDLAALQANLAGAEKKKKDLLDQVDLCGKKLVRAKQLIESLGGEKTKWGIFVEELDAAYINLTGDVLVSAGLMAYLGPFTSTFRMRQMATWIETCKKLSIPSSEKPTLINTLGDAVKIRQWNIEGLPTDDFSVENAITIFAARRWPLMIDPQGQANKWIRQMEAPNKLNVLKMSGEYMRNMESAIQFGFPVLLEDVGEVLDATLEPLLLKQIFKQGGVDCIRLGDATIEYSEMFRFYICTKLRNPHYVPEISVKVTLLNFMITPQGLQDQLLGVVVARERADLEEKKNELVLEGAENKRKLKEIEDQILEILSGEGNILENETAIVTLNQSKVTSDDIKAKQAVAEKTEVEIDNVRKGYTSVAYSTQVLFFCIACLENIEPVYSYSLDWFINLFVASIKNSEPAPDVPTRLDNLYNHFIYSLYKNICRSLLEKDKLLFSFVLTIRILQGKNELDDAEWLFFLTGGVSLDNKHENPAEDWLATKLWNEICLLDDIPAFKGLREHVDRTPHQWRTLYDSTDPQEEPLPGRWDKLEGLKRLCILRCIRPDKVVLGVQKFVIAAMGEKFVRPPPFDLQACYDESSCVQPLVFVLAPGSDPMGSVLEAAEAIGREVGPISLGQGQGPVAEALIEKSRKEGSWVVLQNCHLAESFMTRFEEICDKLAEPRPHENFRLWCTTCPSPIFPTAVLQNGIKMAIEPPKGLRANLVGSYSAAPIANPGYLESNSKPEKFRKLCYSLCIFHALLQERRLYGPLGWNIPYGFNESDMLISLQQLFAFLEENEETPFKALKYCIGECNYGGRVTDGKDRITLNSIMERFFNEDVLETGYKMSDSGTYSIPAAETREQFLEVIEGLPLVAPPEIFGFHENANITKDTKETNAMFATCLLCEGGGGGSGSGDKDATIATTAGDIKEKLPAAYDMEQAAISYPVLWEQSMNTVLCQELARFNNLTNAMKKSLIDVEKAVRGIVVMSGPLEALGDSLVYGAIPAMWKAKSYPSFKPLAGYVTDLLERLNFLNEWLCEKPPSTYWISAFFFQHAFMTASKQNYSRAETIPIDAIGLQFEMLPSSSYAKPPALGVYVYGFFFEGARWDKKQKRILESEPKVLFTTAPLMWFQPKRTVQIRHPPSYLCPVYKTGDRRGILATTGHSTNFILDINVPSRVASKILRRVRAESSRHPPRHLHDICSTAWRCRFLAARPSQDGRAIAEK